MSSDADNGLRTALPVRRTWLWVTAFLSIAALLLGVLASIVVQPYQRARMAAIQLQALGASIDYNESTLPRHLREGWHYISDRNLAIAASAIYCRKDRHRTIGDKDLIHVRAFPGLYWLDVRDQSITSQGLQHLAGLDLEALTLTRTAIGEVPEGTAPLGTLRNLQVLKLNETRINDDDLKSLATLHRLTSLDLAQTQISASGVHHISALSGLSSLNLSQTKVNDQASAHLAKLKNLLVLDLRKTSVTGVDLHLLRSSRLRELALAETSLNDDGLRSLCQLPLLTDVNLAGTRVSPAALRGVTKLRHLRLLNISGDSFTDEHLEAVAGCPRLQTLKVFGAKISPQGFRHLKRLPALTRIELEGNLLWNPELTAALKELPKLTTVEFKLSGKMLFDFAEVQQQLEPRIRVYEVTESVAAK